MSFTDKVVLITGAGSGIGQATAVAFAQQGAKLVLGDINSQGLEQTQALVAAHTNDVLLQTYSVADPEACRQAVAATIAHFGRLDVLCNIAGFARADNFTELTDQDWLAMVGVNLNGVFFMTHAAMPHLLESKGNVVNMGSTAGLVGQAYNSMYCATKGGVVLFTKALAMEYAHRGVRLNVICPGAVKTPLMANFKAPNDMNMSLFSRLMPLLDAAEPNEIAEVITFLASDKARYMTGVALPVDGGQTIG